MKQSLLDTSIEILKLLTEKYKNKEEWFDFKNKENLNCYFLLIHKWQNDLTHKTTWTTY